MTPNVAQEPGGKLVQADELHPPYRHLTSQRHLGTSFSSPPADPQEMSNHHQHGPTTHATSPTVHTCSAGVSLGPMPGAEEPALVPLPQAALRSPIASAAAPGLAAMPVARPEEQQRLGEEKR